MRNFLFVAALIGAVALAPMATAAAAGPEGGAPAAPPAAASPTMPDFADLAFRAGASYQSESVPSESEIPVYRTPPWIKFLAATVGVALVGYLGYRLGGSRAYNRCSGNIEDAAGNFLGAADVRALCDAAFDR